ncbi:glycosyltransferase family 2 protein [Cohnella herbarum]|uniref:Glycosyltransferase family 2 protein n=1 Tax=Cohnella herbarum TaxID=2728023 RepID=A0A7Z2VJ63_9BACL|nr:glycosyltransferase family A protein [Cohnella herbarum]QJD84062.1 glycosyltransferase family 2 protein [Cohnella herbarum]
MTVVVPFYNDPYLPVALESALAQTYEPLEIIVVNDGSMRETNLLERYEGRIRVLNKINGGTASALNAGFRSAKGQYVAWLSSDDRFLPDKIERQVRYMTESGHSISHTAFWQMNGDGETDRQPVVLHDDSMVHFYRSMLESNTVNGCTVMMNKALFTRMGGFSEQLKYTHDYELWLRTIVAGYPIGYLNIPLTEYRIHSGMGSLMYRESVLQEVEDLQKMYIPRLRNLITALQGGSH